MIILDTTGWRVCGLREKARQRMLLLWFVLILAVKKWWLALCKINLHDCMHVSLPTSLRFGHLCEWETRQQWR